MEADVFINRFMKQEKMLRFNFPGSTKLSEFMEMLAKKKELKTGNNIVWAIQKEDGFDSDEKLEPNKISGFVLVDSQNRIRSILKDFKNDKPIDELWPQRCVVFYALNIKSNKYKSFTFGDDNYLKMLENLRSYFVDNEWKKLNNCLLINFDRDTISRADLEDFRTSFIRMNPEKTVKDLVSHIYEADFIPHKHATIWVIREGSKKGRILACIDCFNSVPKFYYNVQSSLKEISNSIYATSEREFDTKIYQNTNEDREEKELKEKPITSEKNTNESLNNKANKEYCGNDFITINSPVYGVSIGNFDLGNNRIIYAIETMEHAQSDFFCWSQICEEDFKDILYNGSNMTHEQFKTYANKHPLCTQYIDGKHSFTEQDLAPAMIYNERLSKLEK